MFATTDGNAMANIILKPFRKLSIRSKLLYGYGLVFILAIVMGHALVYLFIKNTIEADIERELRNTTESILNMVETAIDVSIKNHLRAVAEKNRDVVDHFYHLQYSGKMSEREAKDRAAEVLLSQVMGTTGYIYCINSNGIIQVHPKKQLVGIDLSNYNFIQQQKSRLEGYVEYDWANPDEQTTRPKALYMTYFEPWDWIISASSYREEFKELFNVDDFRESILSLSFGKTGYSYIMDSHGNLILHPKLEGINIHDSKDSSGRMFIKTLCAQKNGKIIYPWQNPGDPAPREKLVIFNYISELDWIVASSSYLDEFYEPLRSIGYASLGMVAFTLSLIIPITWWVSTSITRPIKELIVGFMRGANGDLSSRLSVNNEGEIGQLASYYNTFMEQLHLSRKSLEESEARYRNIFENAIEGVYQSTPGGQFLNANPAFIELLGYDSVSDLLYSTSDIKPQFYVRPEERDTLLQELEEKGEIQDFEVESFKKNGKSIWLSISARMITGNGDQIPYIQGFAVDVSRRKMAEEKLAVINRKLEKLVEERTHELSRKTKELEQANTKLQRQDEMKSDLVSSVSHDLRTPLTSVLGFAKLISKDFNNIFLPLGKGEQRLEKRGKRILDNLSIITEEGERLTRLINDFLDLAKIEEGRMEWHDQKIKLKELFDRSGNAVQGEFYQKPDVQLMAEVGKDVPTLQLDPDRMAQVLINLLNNAVKFTERGSVSMTAAQEASGAVVIKVADTGKDIPPDKLERIFEKFHQVKDGNKQDGGPKGSGLGLVICRNIISHYGGHIWAESEVDKGSTFFIRFPLTCVTKNEE